MKWIALALAVLCAAQAEASVRVMRQRTIHNHKRHSHRQHVQVSCAGGKCVNRSVSISR